MSIASYFHQTIVCRAIPEMSGIDAGSANAITATAVKNIPFKDPRNWLVILLLLIAELPVFAYFFFGNQLANKLTTSNNAIFIASLVLSFLLLPLCWYAFMRVIRPEIISLLTQQKATS